TSSSMDPGRQFCAKAVAACKLDRTTKETRLRKCMSCGVPKGKIGTFRTGRDRQNALAPGKLHLGQEWRSRTFRASQKDRNSPKLDRISCVAATIRGEPLKQRTLRKYQSKNVVKDQRSASINVAH